MRLKKAIKLFLKIAGSIGALYFVFSKIDFGEVWEIYQKSNILPLFLALIFFIFSKFISALRLNHFFKSISVFLSQTENIKLYLVGMFYNLFLPGGIGGDGYKIYVLKKRHTVSTRDLFTAVLSDRISGVVALVTLGIFNIYLVAELKMIWLVAWIFIPVILLSQYFVYKLAFNKFMPILTKTYTMSLLVQTAQVITILFIIISFGIKENIANYTLIFLISSIVALVPISIGGIGVRELTFLYGSRWLGIQEDQAIAISLMFYLITLLVSASGLLYVPSSNKINPSNNTSSTK